MKSLISVITMILLILSLSSHAQQSGDLGDLKNTCEVSGGSWTESGGGNWACCWSDWGCYGCVSGICKIKCHNQRCRDANSVRQGESTPPRTHAVKGLAPAGSLAPVVPTRKIPKAHTPVMNNISQ